MQLTGIYNFCNPGAISHNQVLTIYREEVDPSFQWENFSIEEQAKILAGLFFLLSLSLTHSLALTLKRTRVCMYVYTYIHTYTCMYVYTYIHTYTYTCLLLLSRARSAPEAKA